MSSLGEVLRPRGLTAITATSVTDGASQTRTGRSGSVTRTASLEAPTDVRLGRADVDHGTWAREHELALTRGYVWIPRTDDVERVAVAVLDRNGAPLAAVSIYGPKYRIQDRIPELGKEARQTAARISRAALGIRPGEPGP